IQPLNSKGIMAYKGGEHKNRPTYNVLSYFDLSYIEFIGTSNKEELERMEHPNFSMIKTIINNNYKEGFARFVISTNQIEELADYFREKGLYVNGPIYLSRELIDGTLLEWDLLFVGDGSEGLEFPYFIQWAQNRKRRRKDLIDRNMNIKQSSNLDFSHITLAVNELRNTVGKWSSLLQLDASDVYMNHDLQAESQRLKLPVCDLVFSSPIGTGTIYRVFKY